MPADDSRTTRLVRKQYEGFPYPPREPADERAALIRTYLDHLSLINHYCFKGRQDFRRGFRVLVAGGGTGDAAVYLGEQLKDTDAEIVYVDLSEASMDVARRRAAVRGLENVTWVHGSLLDLPGMDLPPFDYINCVGVLHHLADPRAGLRALRAVLKDDGAMGLMLYARYGRAGVYQMQELMRIINRDEPDDQAKVDNTKAVLGALPETNWFKKGEYLVLDHKDSGDPGIYDLFLHSTDRAYSIPELYELLESAGLNLVTFKFRERAIYTPGVAYQDKGLLEILERLGERDRQAVLELVCGAVIKHSFFASPLPHTVAQPDDPQNVPLFHLLGELGRRLHRDLAGNPGHEHMTVNLPQDIRVEIDIGRLTALLLKHIDGKAPLGEIAERIGREHPDAPSPAEVIAEFEPLYRKLTLWDLLLLRHASADPPPPVDPVDRS